MKKPGLYLYSIIVTGLLTLIFAALIGYVTFFIKDGSEVNTRVLLVNAQWVEALLLLLFFNLILSLFINKLYSRRRWPLLLLHLAFILILAGAAVTRYVGSDGKFHIHDEETTDYVIPEESLNQMVNHFKYCREDVVGQAVSSAV